MDRLYFNLGQFISGLFVIRSPRNWDGITGAEKGWIPAKQKLPLGSFCYILSLKFHLPLGAEIHLVLLAEAALVDRQGDAHQLVVVDNRFVPLRVAEGLVKEHFLIEDDFALVTDDRAQAVAVIETCLREQFTRDVGP